MIPEERIQILKSSENQNRDYVLYWMQASQRTHYNHALEFAIDQANDRQKPLIVFFGITESFPDANERHFAFMLQGILEVWQSLNERNIEMIVQLISPELGALKLSKNADLVITDRGYLRIQKKWRQDLARQIDCPLIQVESDVLVPVEAAYSKSAFGAYVLRPKIHKAWMHFQAPMQHRIVRLPPLNLDVESIFPDTWQHILEQLNVDRSVKMSPYFTGGYTRARKDFELFIQKNLDVFHEDRNDPSEDRLSNLSPYLHFGQISPLEILEEMRDVESPGKEAFLEELIIRRELSMNFVHYEKNYDQFECLPDWANQTLFIHDQDPREFIYTPEQFEKAETHDRYWNAAQKELLITGKMHGYMRMYWGKKILEWSDSAQNAFRIALWLNNKYELDGRDPNGFAGVAWCFGKHDRAWAERPVYGKVRTMSAKGLERKFDIQKYVDRINHLEVSH